MVLYLILSNGQEGGFSYIWVKQETVVVKPAPTQTPNCASGEMLITIKSGKLNKVMP